MIYGVSGVTIWTEDLEHLVLFYRDVLGLPIHSQRSSFVVFRFEGFRLNLGVHSRVLGKTLDPNRIMINLGVEDIHLEFNTLAQKGVEFIRLPEKESWGGWVATFRDPDGNVLQLLQQP